MNIIESLKWRYAVKKFEPGKMIPEATWKTIEEALVLSPSSFGLEPSKFIIVTNPEMKKRLRAVSYNQSQVEDCSHLIVFCSRKIIDKAYIEHFVQRTAEITGTPLSSLDGYKNTMISYFENNKDHAKWASEQTFISLGNVLATAAILGVDARPMGGFVNDKYDEILELKDYHAAVICTFGFRSKEDTHQNDKKVRLPKEELIQYIK